MSDNNFIPMAAYNVTKTIYAKKKSTQFNKDTFSKIIQNEVDYHLSKYPGLKFKNIEKPKHNDDRSLTYTIKFERKLE
jgi:hypothetical protein